MKNKAIPLIFLAIILLLPCTGAFGTVRVAELSGKVEVKLPGEVSWEPAETGMELPLNTDISTGFRSYALLDLGSSQIEVMALTRMKVEEVIEGVSGVTTSLLLGAGTVRADVKTSETRTTDFTITSPIATAAVRGTSFVFNGYILNVLEGIVLYINVFGERISVPAGAASRTTGFSVPLAPLVVLTAETVVETAPLGSAEPVTAGEAEPPPPPLGGIGDAALPSEEGLCIDLIVE